MLIDHSLLRNEELKPAAPPRPAHAHETQKDRGRLLACAFCRRPITTTAAAIEVGGSHAHTFTNPEGIAFRVGCFSEAHGLAPEGPRSDYWTWFPGYSWQVELCAHCHAQLGWLYRSSDGRFHGLILDSLVEVEDR